LNQRKEVQKPLNQAGPTVLNKKLKMPLLVIGVGKP
jgi:hypothetical protein